MHSWGEITSLVVVALLWGLSNPFLRRGAKGIETVKSAGLVRQTLAELRFIFFNARYMIPFLINQLGSLLYYVTLASADLSLAVILTNSLTVIFTIISGAMLGERLGGKQAVLGVFLTMCGLILCITSNIRCQKGT
uniref:transmembrane protein 234 isoform X1 n=1 Tax=Myxine glutinosa TaxID=7769 RepID=UPI00358FD9CE